MMSVVLSASLLLLKVLAAYLVYMRVLKMCYLRILYGLRGVAFVSNVPKPFVGDALEIARRVLEEPDRPHFTTYLREVFPEKMPPCVGLFWMNSLQLLITDPDYVQDLFTTYNEVFTKQEYAKTLFSDLIWNCLMFQKSAEPSYKPRRKILSHAFYASKLKAMSDTIFSIIHKRLLEWPSLYPGGELDLVGELVQIQGQIVVSVSIGMHYANEELPYKDY